MILSVWVYLVLHSEATLCNHLYSLLCNIYLSNIKIPRRFVYTYLLYLLFTNVKGWLDTSIVALRRIMIIDIPYISIIIMPHSKPHDDGGTAELIDYQNILKHSLIFPFCCNSILFWFVCLGAFVSLVSKITNNVSAQILFSTAVLIIYYLPLEIWRLLVPSIIIITKGHE